MTDRTDRMSWEPDITLLETLLDIRDLLQKLVEKGQKTKIVTTEVPFTEKENELLKGLDEIQA